MHLRSMGVQAACALAILEALAAGSDAAIHYHLISQPDLLDVLLNFSDERRAASEV